MIGLVVFRDTFVDIGGRKRVADLLRGRVFGDLLGFLVFGWFGEGGKGRERASAFKGTTRERSCLAVFEQQAEGGMGSCGARDWGQFLCGGIYYAQCNSVAKDFVVLAMASRLLWFSPWLALLSVLSGWTEKRE